MARKTTDHITIAEGIYYLILSARGGKALTAGANNQIIMQNREGGSHQLWSFVADGDAWKIVSRQTGEVIDVMLSGVDNGAQIHQWEDVGAENQKWIAEPAEDGYFRLKSKLSGRCLDIVGLSDQDGAHIQIWDQVEGDNQLWQIMDPNASKREPDKTAQPAEKPKRPRKPAAPSAEPEVAAVPAEPETEPKAVSKRGRKPAAKTAEKPVKTAQPKAEKKSPAKKTSPKAEK